MYNTNARQPVQVDPLHVYNIQNIIQKQRNKHYTITYEQKI